MVSGILFVHGIQGSPSQLRFLTERLPPLRASSVIRGGEGSRDTEGTE